MSAARSASGGRRTASSTRTRKAGKKTGSAAGKTAKKKTSKVKKKATAKKKKKKTAAGKKKTTAVRKTATARKKTAKVKKKATARKKISKVKKKAAAPSKTATRKKKKATARKKTAVRKTAGRPVRGGAQATPAAERPAPGASALRYKEALDAYSKAVALLQKKEWETASRALADVVSEYPRERELAERARMYLRVCSQHLQDDSVDPQDFDGRYYRAVVLSNQGRTDRALEVIDKALASRPRSRKAMYLKASILALAGKRRDALDALSAAIDLDEQNRIFATNDPDFAGLRDDEEFITLTTREDEED